ncbi:glucosidase II beta subunit-like protein-domain-containing protein [Xylogone sp. PMI_703]|nr:glucosidase II beta subunit-like protein-domain-containing protein [Xylogone sp. PMI_703]
MRYLFHSLLVLAPIVSASQTVFSIHDDVLAFPQYEIYFSQSVISDIEAYSLLDQTPKSPSETEPPPSADTKSISSHTKSASHDTDPQNDPTKVSYELMHLKNRPYLCTIPFVTPPLKNETSEAEARAAEAKELARATDRGWELLQDLEGSCLYFVSGWWSYSFCYNSEVTQFHAITQYPGKAPTPPERDPNSQMYVLGRVKSQKTPVTDEWGNEVEKPKQKITAATSAGTELQVKGDTRYLVQKLEGGTICDLTGKPRRVEVQYHCMPNMSDRIGYIKEVTTCSYLLVVYTPRLCNDVAFAPSTENKANAIVCKAVVPEGDMGSRGETKSLESEISSSEAKTEGINIGGVIIGGGKYVGKEGRRIPIAADFGTESPDSKVEIIASGKSEAEGGAVEVMDDEELQKLDLDPDIVEAMKVELESVAKGRAWSIKVVDAPGQVRQILMIIDDEEEAEGGNVGSDDEGSEEVYKEEL